MKSPDQTSSTPIRRPATRPPAPTLSKFIALRRLAGKLARRAKKLANRPDNSPWVITPRRDGTPKTYADFVFGLDYLSPNSQVVQFFHEAMSPYGLSVLLVNTSNVDRVIAEIERGWLRPYVYLDLASTTVPRFNDLLLTAARHGVYVIDHPDGLTDWTYKANSHQHLARAGLPLPPSVILPKGSPDRELTAVERAQIGDRCVLKPSAGFGNRGVVVGVEPTAANIIKARDFDRNDDWLVQRMISWTRFGERPAYLRGYNLLGHRTLMWWCRQGDTDCYDLLSWDDLRTYNLLPAVNLIDRIAAASSLDFFSSEIAITSADPADPNRFVLIDYINDQCDMDPEARAGTSAIPEPWIKWVCARLAQFTWRIKRGLPPEGHKTLTLF